MSAVVAPVRTVVSPVRSDVNTGDLGSVCHRIWNFLTASRKCTLCNMDWQQRNVLQGDGEGAEIVSHMVIEE